MSPELKAEWIAALRSGKYRQGQTALRTKSDEYCCLGVLCNIVDPAGWRSSFSSALRNFRYDDDPDVSGIPGDAMLRHVGLDVRLAHDLAAMNDAGKSFFAISEAIDQRA